jgi:hypothetical protein
VIVQYWRSFEHLEAYARDADQQHWPAWVDFNRGSGAVAETWVSGMKPTGCVPGNTSVCTAECHPLVWRKPARR